MKRRYVSGTKGPKPFYNTMQQVRAHLGLTQQHMADLLGVSRSAVAMDERGERSLPWPSLTRIVALQQVLPAPAGPAPTPPVGPLLLTDTNRADLDFRRRELAIQVYPLEHQLAHLRVQLAQARLWQQALPALRASFGAADADGQQWLNYFEGHAALVLSHESGAAALVELRLATLAFEMGEITRLLGEG